MQVKAVVLWWLINGKDHPTLNQEDKKISALQPLLQALFPGMNYYSNTGFQAAVRGCAIPALQKQFPELAVTPAAHLRPDVMLEVEKVMPSNGFEWQGDDWAARFESYLRS